MTAVRRFRVPPALAAIAVTAIYGTVNVGVPIALSTLGSKRGWEGTRPGLPNLVGLAPSWVSPPLEPEAPRAGPRLPRDRSGKRRRAEDLDAARVFRG
jgi:hypothetical protein